MRRVSVILGIIAMVLLSSFAFAKDKDNISFMVEQVLPRHVIVSFDTAINMGPTQLFPRPYSREPQNALATELSKVTAIDSAFMYRYEISFFLKSNSTWEQTSPEILERVKTYFERIGMPPLKEVSVLQKSACELVRVSPKISENDMGLEQICITDRRFVVLVANKLLSTRGNYAIWRSRSPMYYSEVEIIKDLSAIEGINAIEFNDNRLVLERATMYEWKSILPQVFKIIQEKTRTKTAVVKVSDKLQQSSAGHSALFPGGLYY